MNHGLNQFDLYMPALADLDQFDAVEIDPVMVELAAGGLLNVERISESEIGTDSAAQYHWSVYLHMKEGGVVCAGDFPTKSLAETYAKFVEATLSWSREATQ